jgi:hypothetical protein
MNWRSPMVLVPLVVVLVLLVGVAAFFVGRSSQQAATPGSTATPSPAVSASTTTPPPAQPTMTHGSGTRTRTIVTAPVPASAKLFAHPNEPAYVPGKGFAPDAERILDILSLQISLARYHVALGRYPRTLQALFPRFAPIANGKPLARVPLDPQTHQPYTYAVGAGGTTYVIGATLSNGQRYTGVHAGSAALGSGEAR